MARITRVIQDGIDKGELSPSGTCQTYATLFLGLINGLMLHSILGIGSHVDQKLVAAFKDLFLTGLGSGANDASDNSGSMDNG
jgi:hypothetical protein